jgi:nitrile hydratase
MTEHDSKTIADIHHELHSHLPSEPALRVKALENLLVEKGMVDPAAIDAWVDVYRDEIGPRRGAEIIARAWVDADFKARLLADANEAIKEFGLESSHLTVIENTDDTHNLVVCTLCSCYPNSVLGPPPNWYKMAAYRSRAVRDPRGVLKEFGVELPDNVNVRVWDSTAELRFMIMPQRPAGTEDWSEEKLADLITRNAMIGTDRDLSARMAEIG